VLDAELWLVSVPATSDKLRRDDDLVRLNRNSDSASKGNTDTTGSADHHRKLCPSGARLRSRITLSKTSRIFRRRGFQTIGARLKRAIARTPPKAVASKMTVATDIKVILASNKGKDEKG